MSENCENGGRAWARVWLARLFTVPEMVATYSLIIFSLSKGLLGVLDVLESNQTQRLQVRCLSWEQAQERVVILS